MFPSTPAETWSLLFDQFHCARGQTDGHVTVKRLPLASAAGRVVDAYFKVYEYPKPGLRYLGRKSKARREAESYDVFERLKIPCAEAIAWGEDRDLIGRLKRAFIITRAIDGALPLTDFVPKRCPDRRTAMHSQWRDTIIDQLAAFTRRIHLAGFFHNDLHWRNVLVTVHSDQPRLWWIDCPRGQFERFRRLARHRRTKDLATLDRTAIEWCTLRERARFVRRYISGSRAVMRTRDLLLGVHEYRKRRWPASSVPPGRSIARAD